MCAVKYLPVTDAMYAAGTRDYISPAKVSIDAHLVSGGATIMGVEMGDNDLCASRKRQNASVWARSLDGVYSCRQ